MSMYEADKWYWVKGEVLMMVRYGLYALERDMREDALSSTLVFERLREIRDMLPHNPPAMNGPPI